MLWVQEEGFQIDMSEWSQGFTQYYANKYKDADKSLAGPERKISEACQGRARFQQHRDADDIKYRFLQVKAPKEIHAVLTETLACFLPGRAKDLSAPL